MFRRRSDEDFRHEIEAHLAIEIDRLVAEGMSPSDARQQAVRAFGNVTRTRERFYESRRMLWLDELCQDVTYAWRALRRSPGFAGVALITLALGIGANTAIFSVVNTVLLRPLPYRDPASLALVQAGEVGLTPGPVVRAWRERATSVSELAGFNGPRAATLVAGGESAQIDAADVTWNLLSFLGTPPALGRDFTEADSRSDASTVFMLTNELWRSRFGGDSGILGRTITVSGGSGTVIGVAAEGFRFPTAGALPAYGLPIDTQPDVMRAAGENPYLNVIARIEPGLPVATATAELLTIYRQASEGQFSRSLLDRLELSIAPLHETLVGDVSVRLWLVMGAVTFVLLVACANVANLLLARASARQRELVVRSALGARNGRLVRLLLTESLVLSLMGSAGALVVAYFASGVARTLLAQRVPHVESIGIDWWVLGFNAAIAVATGLLCGLASLPGTARINPVTVLSESGTATVTGRSVTRRLLLAAQVSVTFVLVVGAALLGQTLWNLSAKDRGFEAARLLTLRVFPGLPADIDVTDRAFPSKYFAAFFTDLTTELRRVAGVESVAAVSTVPFAGTGAFMGSVVVDGQSVREREDASAAVASVSPGYFQAMRIGRLAGRDFDERDRLGSEKVAIVNEAFVRRFAPAGNIVGSSLRSGSNAMTIVGVVADIPELTLRESPKPLVYFALSQMAMHQFGWGQLRLVLRTTGDDPMAAAPAVRARIWAIDPDIVIDEVATMDERVAAVMRSERDSALLFGLFAAAALVMAAIGVFGVASYAIAQRTREIGIRVALGAARRDIRKLVISHTLWPTAAGIAVGVGSAVLLTRFIASMVYGVTPVDPATFVAAVIVLAGVALAATWAPSRRATRIDPLVALRYE